MILGKEEKLKQLAQEGATSNSKDATQNVFCDAFSRYNKRLSDQ